MILPFPVADYDNILYFCKKYYRKQSTRSALRASIRCAKVQLRVGIKPGKLMAEASEIEGKL
jgi:hypothetical protein